MSYEKYTIRIYKCDGCGLSKQTVIDDVGGLAVAGWSTIRVVGDLVARNEKDLCADCAENVTVGVSDE